MKKSVIYVSKALKESQTQINFETFFPFLNSQQFNIESKKRLSFKSLEGVCSSKNILQYIQKRPPCKCFVFFGRSNVGKSSLINRLIGAPVNPTSKQPGKTKQLAFLHLNTTHPTYFVDAPGYGFANAASKEEIKSWGKLVELYLKNTDEQSEQIMLLLDINHGIKLYDKMLMDMLTVYKKKFIIVFTKCDKVSAEKYDRSVKLVEKVQQKYENMNFYVHYTSSKTLFGIQDLRSNILFRILMSDEGKKSE